MSAATDADGRGTGLLWAEIALTSVTAATAAGMARLFTSADFLPDLLVVVVAAHAVNAVVRRRGWRAWLAAPVVIAAGILVVCWFHLGSSLRGGLPTGDTWRLAYDMLHDAFAPFRGLVPPVDLNPGFALTMSLATWILASFADAAAFRGEAPVQAIVPCIAGFLFTSILADGRAEVVATAAMVLCIGCWATTWRMWAARRTPWVESTPGSGSRSLLRGGLALSAVATVAALLLGPYLPGSRDSALVDLRRVGQGPSNRVADNPLVGVGSLLRERSDDPLFEVASRQPHYWRLTSLESFDGQRQSWFSDQRFAEVDASELPLPSGENALGPPGTEVSRFTITGLEGIWLPSVYFPRSVRVDDDVRFSTESGSLITDKRSDGVNGLTYSVRSTVANGARPPRSAITPVEDESLLAVPADLDVSLAPLTAQIISTAGARGPIGRARAIQDWFRANFTYDVEADFSDADDPTLAFLRARRGFCQQFASTFALMARTVGLRTRVAVGFTYGEPKDPEDPDNTVFVVRGRQAHAWPEVLVDGVGWLAFEPTPTRGNPDAASWTGVTAAQDDGDLSPVTTTTAAPTTTALAATPSTSAAPLPDQESAGASEQASPARWWEGPLRVLLVALAAVATVAAVVGLRWASLRMARDRRRAAAQTPASKVGVAWQETGEWLAARALRRRPDETIDEFARRVGRVIPELEHLDELGRLAERRVYSVEPLDDTDAGRAVAAAEEVGTVVAAGMTRRERVAHELGLPRRRATPRRA